MAYQRSPNYPGKALPGAIKDAQILYQQEQTAPIPREVAAKAFGYGTVNGLARMRLSALKQYGLLESGQKGSMLKLSKRALALVVQPTVPPVYEQALKEAALTPKYYREFYEQRRTASDASLKHELVSNRQFTDDGATKFVKIYRQTIAFAGLETSRKTLTERVDLDKNVESEAVLSFPEIGDQDKIEADMAHHDLSTVVADATEKTLQLPLASSQWLTLHGKFPVSEADWNSFMAMLKTMKPGLIKRTGASGSQGATSEDATE